MDSLAIAALSKLLSLFGLSFIAREAGDFLEDGYLSGQQVCHHDMLWRDFSLTLQGFCMSFPKAYVGCPWDVCHLWKRANAPMVRVARVHLGT